MASRYISDLGPKLALLFRDPVINSQKKLAEALGVSEVTISKYINGVSEWVGIKEKWLREPNMVPIKRIPGICDLFKIDQAWLELPLQEFEKLLQRHIVRRSAWEDLILQAVPSSEIDIVPVGIPIWRGLIQEDETDEEPFPVFKLDTRVYFKITPPAWPVTDDVSEALTYLVLLVVDRHKTHSLCPSKSQFVPDHVLHSETTIQIPSDAPAHTLKVTAPSGEQSLLALFTRKPLPDLLFTALQNDQMADHLEQLAIWVNTQPIHTWVLFKKNYEVY